MFFSGDLLKLLTGKSRVVIVEPQARGAIVIEASGVGCTVGGGVVQCRLKGCRRVHKLCGNASVDRGEVCEVLGQQSAVLCDEGGWV